MAALNKLEVLLDAYNADPGEILNESAAILEAATGDEFTMLRRLINDFDFSSALDRVRKSKRACAGLFFSKNAGTCHQVPCPSFPRVLGGDPDLRHYRIFPEACGKDRLKPGWQRKAAHGYRAVTIL